MVELSEHGERNRKLKNKSLQFIGIFIMMLVLTLPFYSANAMASSVKVTKNYGTDGVEGYLDAESDIWTLEVEITADDEEAIQPEQVILEVGGSQIEFNSCSSSSLTSTCEFQSVLSNGISEGTYVFEVVLYDLEIDPEDENVTELGSELASDTDSIIADGSEPSISFSSIYQDEGDLYLDFTVSDQPNACVGLDTIKVVDAQTGETYETFTVGEIGNCDFDYAGDAGTAGVFSVQLEGEEYRYFKIKATDLLGHEEISASKGFDSDFVAPVIDTSSLSLADFGDYIGDYVQTSNVVVNVTECNELDEVTATSDYIEFSSQPASCTSVDAEQCIHECTWTNLYITPSGSSVSASITAKDDSGNEVTSTASSSFTTDSDSPSVVFLGTLATYSDLSYVASDEDATIYAFIDEGGSGIDKESVVANLAGIGGSSEDYPTECLEDGSGTADYYCYWDLNVKDNDGSTSSSEINIHYLEDKVGNSGESVSVPIVVDGVVPKVTDIEFYGYSAQGQKDYFQSNDDLWIDLSVSESSGLQVYVDADDIVMDAENTYQYGTYDEDGDYVASEWDGWVAFDESGCTRDEETSEWECEYQIDSIKSGPDSSAEINVRVFDTAGNLAEWESESNPENADTRDYGEFEIEIFALDEETQPDFWEQSTGRTYTESFVDLDSAAMINPRIMFTIGLTSDVGAKSGLINLAECVPVDDGPEISRALIYGGTYTEPSSSPSPSVILEFNSFDAEDVVVFSEMTGEEFSEKILEYECNLHIYSVLDDTAFTYAESQIVSLDVPFAYTGEGSLDENVDAYLQGIADNTGFKILDSLKVLNTVLKWINYLKPVFSILMTVVELVDGLNQGQDEIRTTPQGFAIASALCHMDELNIKASLAEVQKVIGPVLDVVTCNPSQSQIASSWYGKWQRGVITSFNMLNYGGIQGAGSVSLYDNIWISMAGLCVPGIIHNLEKLRQVYCYEAKCLMVDVPAGLATVDTCQQVFEVMKCKYVYGELVASIMPLAGLGEFISSTFKSILTNPLGLITFTTNLICAVSMCSAGPTGGKAAVVCSKIAYVFKVLDVIENIFNMVQGYPTLQYDLCKEIGFDKNYGQTEEADAESVTTEDVTSATDSSSTDSGAEEAEA